MDRIRLSLIVATLIIFGCQAIPATQSGSPPVNLTCTAVGCGPSLQVELVGEIPSDFVLTAVASTGETVSVHCLSGAAVYDAQTTTGKSPICSQNRVAFSNFAPEQVTITVRWDDLEVSQSFQPAYQVSYPNGPACEPECRSAKVEFHFEEWKTYINTDYHFSFDYPANFEIVPGINDTSFYVGEKIFFYISNRDPLDCQGDCSVVETTETVTVAGLQATRVTGYIGSVGGNIPQRYLAFLFQREDLYYNFTLYALSVNATTNDPTVIWPLEDEDVELFERMMETFKFTN